MRKSLGKEQVSGYLIGLNNSYIIQLCKKGDLAYKDRLGRVNRDLKRGVFGITFGSLSVLDAITLLSDATYIIYINRMRGNSENMDKYLAGMGDKAELELYSIARGSFRGVQRESVEKQLTQRVSCGSRLWKRNVPTIAYSSVNDDGTMFSGYRQQRRRQNRLITKLSW